MTIEEIEKGLPNGFHDAHLKKLSIDYIKRQASIDIEIDIGSPDAYKEDYRNGVLILFDLLFCVIDSPDLRYLDKNINGLWITDSGPVDFEKNSKLPSPLPNGAFVYFFYVNNWNTSIYVAAMDAQFEWAKPL